MTTPKTTALDQVIAWLAAAFVVFLLVTGGQAQESYYRPDYIDLERHANWKALQSERYDQCIWWGRGCHWRHSHRYAPRIPRSDPAIKWAQQKLQRLGYELDDDGIMGEETRDAVRRFQRESGLEVTGELGPRTWALLDEEREDNDRGKRRDHETVVGIWGKVRAFTVGKGKNSKLCLDRTVYAFTNEVLAKDARRIGQERWRGAVRAQFGEFWQSWEGAENHKEFCWQSGTGERLVDSHVRCFYEANPCFHVSKDYSDDPERKEKGR